MSASQKAAKEKGLVLGVNIVVLRIQWGSLRSDVADTSPFAMGDVG